MPMGPRREIFMKLRPAKSRRRLSQGTGGLGVSRWAVSMGSWRVLLEVGRACNDAAGRGHTA